jgi:hypothetical protein
VLKQIRKAAEKNKARKLKKNSAKKKKKTKSDKKAKVAAAQVDDEEEENRNSSRKTKGDKKAKGAAAKVNDKEEEGKRNSSRKTKGGKTAKVAAAKVNDKEEERKQKSSKRGTRKGVIRQSTSNNSAHSEASDLYFAAQNKIKEKQRAEQRKLWEEEDAADSRVSESIRLGPPANSVTQSTLAKTTSLPRSTSTPSSLNRSSTPSSSNKTASTLVKKTATPQLTQSTLNLPSSTSSKSSSSRKRAAETDSNVTDCNDPKKVRKEVSTVSAMFERHKEKVTAADVPAVEVSSTVHETSEMTSVERNSITSSSLPDDVFTGIPYSLLKQEAIKVSLLYAFK